MNTTVVTVDKEHPDEKVMEEAGRILKAGGTGCFSYGDGLRSGRRRTESRLFPEDLPGEGKTFR